LKIVTADEMREIDRNAIEVVGIPGVVLMENAGRAVADTVKNLLEHVASPRVCIFAGKGNNGGDGFVVARHLANSQFRVKTFLLGEIGQIQGDAKINLDILMGMGMEVEELNADGLPTARVAMSMSDLVIDAVFGTGFKGEVEGYVSHVIDTVNESGRPVVAVDVPSGLDSTTGRVSSSCVKATHTVTFGLPKVGLLLYPGAAYAGELVVADIGLPRSLLVDDGLKLNLSTADKISNWIPVRDQDSHKGTFGKALVIAGSPNMSGAAALTGTAALKAGAGLVTLGVPISLHSVMNSKLTEVMTRGLPETESGSISLQAQPLLDGVTRGADALAIGPGLSTHSETAQLVRNMVMTTSVPTVVDADGINAIAQDPGTLKAAKAPIVLTPHPGEMARLTGLPIQEVKRDSHRSHTVSCMVVLSLNSAVPEGGNNVIKQRKLSVKKSPVLVLSSCQVCKDTDYLPITVSQSCNTYPNSSCITLATSDTTALTADSSGPSPRIRTNDSVPEGRTKIRPSLLINA
jgi:hydroxyethylthiazole kinase-like uncharacterized protein yjeF